MTEQFAVQFNKPGQPLEVLKLNNIPIPKVQPGEILVRLKARPINPSDLLWVRGQYLAQPKGYPAQVGFEGAGIVEEIGEGVDLKLKGSNVFILVEGAGSWAEFAVVPVHAAVPIPNGVSFEHAAQFLVNPVTAYALLEELNIPKGEWLFVDAATSALGRILIQISKFRGFKIFAVVRKNNQVEELKKFGADIVVSTESEDWVAEIKKVNNGAGIKYAVDAIGGEFLETLVENLSDGGYVIAYGLLSGQVKFTVNLASLLQRHVSLSGFWLLKWLHFIGKDKAKEVYAEVFSWIAAKKLTLPFTPFDLKTQFIEAIKDAEGPGKVTKAVLVSN